MTTNVTAQSHACNADAPPIVSPGQIVLHMRPDSERPRNSEGAFVTLRDGRVLFIYSHFTGGGEDHSAARLDARYSSDGGCTWTQQDTLVLDRNAGQNLMSVSLLRLLDGRIAMFYLHKESDIDCRPFARFSSDEGQTWSDATCCTPTPTYYYVLNNDRVIQLRTGRLVMPLAFHPIAWNEHIQRMFLSHGALAFWSLSDDGGATWRLSSNYQALPVMPPSGNTGLQEPGVVELNDGRLLSWFRTGTGCQWISYSTDQGQTWTFPQPSEFRSPASPMSIKRMRTGELLAIWNDHSGRFPIPDMNKVRSINNRLPLVSAVSRDEGVTWSNHKLVENEPHRAYCYVAIHGVDEEHTLLAYCAGGAPDSGETLHSLRIRRIPNSYFLQ